MDEGEGKDGNGIDFDDSERTKNIDHTNLRRRSSNKKANP
jgi:hypothetical protein